VSFSAVKTRSSSADEIANVNFLRRHHTRTTKYNRLAHKFRHNVNRKPSIKARKATVKRNLNDKLKVSNAEILIYRPSSLPANACI